MRVDDQRIKRCLDSLSSTVGVSESDVKRTLEEVLIRPYAHLMTNSLEAARVSLIDALNEISDDVERYQAAKSLEARLDGDFKEIKAKVARNLYDGRTWEQVGGLLGVTGSRAEQISRGAR